MRQLTEQDIKRRADFILMGSATLTPDQARAKAIRELKAEDGLHERIQQQATEAQEIEASKAVASIYRGRRKHLEYKGQSEAEIEADYYRCKNEFMLRMEVRGFTDEGNLDEFTDSYEA